MGEKREEEKEETEEKIKVVLDTNIWVSLIIGKQLMKNFWPVIEDERQFAIYISHQMLAELGRALTYPKIDEILRKSKIDPRIVLASLLKRSSLQSVPEGAVGEIISDPSDNRVLECAVHSKADYIVSGDSHLLDLGEFKGIKIVRAREFLSATATAARS